MLVLYGMLQNSINTYNLQYHFLLIAINTIKQKRSIKVRLMLEEFH